jgi:DNA-directed RNA polymerase subunit RPC12/RpoP
MNTKYGIRIGDVVLTLDTKEGRGEMVKNFLRTDIYKDMQYTGEERFIPQEDNSNWFELVSWDADRHHYRCTRCFEKFSVISPIHISEGVKPVCGPCGVKEANNVQPQE